MATVIKVKNLQKSFRVKQQEKIFKTLFKPNYKTIYAVKGVDFEVQRGEAVAFLGPNGAGKTTTIKMMTGLVHPSDGEALVLGFDPFLRKPEFLRRIGLVMGNKASLNWDLTPNQSFNLIKNIYNLKNDFAQKRINELAELLDVTHLLNTQMRSMSLGERMKMELIGSILHKPEILFLDEPTIGLDILTKKKVRKFLKNIQRKENTTLILTSHDIDDIEIVCDRVIVINKGQKCFDDSISALINKYQHNRYLRFTLEESLSKEKQNRIKEFALLEKNDDETDTEEATYLFKTNTEKMVPLINYVLSNSNVTDIKIESVPLEDVIADLFTNSPIN